ncbi:hypothetical protein GON26_00425 [Flavobacterium sp. GA093]|uniref:Uncharacterized protein n=1 Tax=Flavobacterium hydrocarbonoxydans TaxID=2683249 RepID=A0A6I4NE54_9FLAO|nr:hypothetical protein [Flavobacterium hydrocarbonoxydans]MWB92820.1 hypothetical protein [Flavobacterium hydrocarbonoxydans]
MNLITEKPSHKDLVGKYKIVHSDYNFPNPENYILELKENGTFSFTKNPAISLCSNGNYELDYKFEDNEISFQCGFGWSPAHIKRNFRGFEIEFSIDENDKITYSKY